MESKTKWVGTLLAVFFVSLGWVGFEMVVQGTELCGVRGNSFPYMNLTETVNYNQTFSAMGRYYCEQDAEIDRDTCLNTRDNMEGCYWCARLSGSGKTCYVIEDPELPSTAMNLSSLDSMELIDVGLDKTRGVNLDLIENGLTHKVLEIEIEKNISAQDIGLLLKNANFDVERINGKLEKLETMEYQDDIFETLCNPFNTILPNSSIQRDENCTEIFKGETTKNKTIKEEINLKANDTTKTKNLRIYNLLTKGIYHYTFDIPMESNANAGEIMLVFDDLLLTDRQHSTTWNYTWDYRQNMTITNNDADDDLITHDGETLGYTINFTVDTASLKTAGKLNPDCGDLRIICKGVEVDRVFINDTVLDTDVNKGCIQSATEILFMLNFNISAGTSNASGCYMLYGNDTAIPDPLNDANNVFLIHDNYDSANGWTGVPGESCTIEGGDYRAPSANYACYKNITATETDVYLPKFIWGVSVNLTSGYHLLFVHNSSHDVSSGVTQGGTTLFPQLSKFDMLQMNGWIIYKSATYAFPSSVWTHLKVEGYDFNSTTPNDYRVWNGTAIPPKNYLSFDITNLTDTSETTDFILRLQIQTNKANTDRLDNLYLMRSVEDKPTVILGSEQEPPSLQEAPIVDYTVIEPSTAYNDDDLNCTFSVYDDDAGDVGKLSVNITWYNESTPVFSFNFSVSNATRYSRLLTSGNTSKAQNWSCNVTAYDGTDTGINSTQITISDSTPYWSVQTQTVSTSAGSQDNYTYTCTDIDSDSMTYFSNITLYSCASSIGSSSGILSYTPSYPDIGLERVLLNCTDGTSINNTYVNWTVTAAAGAAAVSKNNQIIRGGCFI